MTHILRRIARPFAAVWQRFAAAGWAAKAAIVVGLVVGVPLALLVTVYLLPPQLAVAMGKPLLGLLSDAPPLPSDLTPVTERSVILAADGSELATLIDEKNRVRVELDEIADVALDALLAAEDEHFYDHPGLDHRAVMRAALINFRSGGVEQGGSTLTQQLVKNVYLEPSRTVRRKLTEAWYALELEDRLSKDQILQRYLNEAYFGQGTYGIEAASQLYFAKPAAKLDAREAATLVGIIPSPSRLNPVDDEEASREARDRVLDRMAAVDSLPADQAAEAQDSDLGLDVTPPPPPEEPFFVAYIRERLATDPVYDAALGKDPAGRERLIFGGGLTVHTTLDPDLQQHATAAIDEVMGEPESSPLATLVTVEPATGAIRAMAVGPKKFGQCGDDDDSCPRTMVNPAVPGLGGSGRQPGSAFKPFVLAAALSEGLPPGWEERTRGGREIDGCEDGGEPYEPENYSPDSGVKDMRAAIRVSNNVYHAKLAGLLGPEALVETARTMGLRGGQLPEQCSVALGSGSTFPLAMAAAYATLANEGSGCTPHAITRIELGRPAGGGEERYEPDCERTIEKEIAAHLNDLLQEPVSEGTGTAAQLDREVAGKTGTTDDYKDAWFVGYIPQLATAAWVGFEQPEEMEDVLGVPLVTGGTIPADLWATYMRRAVEDLDAKSFADPPDIEPVEVPRFRGDEASDVRRTYEEDYTFNIETRRTTDYRDRGTVVRQRPKAGQRVPPGTLVTLFVSDGKGDPPRVPDVVGLPRDEATEVLTDADYEVDVERQRVDRPRRSGEPRAGTVVRTDPAAGARLRPGREVTIVVVSYARGDDSEDGDDGDDRDERDDRDDRDDDDEDDEDDRPAPAPTEQPAPARTREVTIARVVANPRGDDLQPNGGEHVTIEAGRTPVDVSGWTITYEGGGTLRIGAGYRLRPGGAVDVHTGTGDDDPPNRYFNDLRREVLEDDGGVLILRDQRGREVDRREY